MKEQNQIIQMENNVEVVAKKANPLLKFLKFALIGVTAFIVLTVLFAVGADVINPTVDSVMQKMGITESIVADTSPVAHAWTSPAVGSGGGGGGINLSSNQDSRDKKVAPLTNSGYDAGTSLWHYVYTVSGGTIDGNGGFTTGGYALAAVDFKAIYYVDIKVTEEMRNAIKNGQLSSISVSLYADSNGGKENWYEVANAKATLQFSAFMLSTADSTYENKDASINNFPTSYHKSHIINDQWTDYVPVDDHKQYTANLSLSLTGSETKIRFGWAWKLTYASRSSTQTSLYASAPTISTSFKIASGYTTGKIQFKVNTDGESKTTGGTIATTADTKYSYSNLSSAINNGDKTYSLDYANNASFVAKPNYGYYFAGWKISGGNAGRTITSGYTSRYPQINIPGGGYVSTSTVVATACFRKIDTQNVAASFDASDVNVEWDYLQDANGNAIAQGPSVTVPTINDGDESCSFEITGGVINTNKLPDKGTINNILNPMYYSVDGSLFNYQSENKMPTEAGTYRMVARIFVKGETGTPQAELGFVYQDFKINPISIVSNDEYTVTFEPFDGETEVIPSRVFNNEFYTPTPERLRIKLTFKAVHKELYYVLKSDDYTKFDKNEGGSYANNKYATSSTYVTALTVNATNSGKNNFTGINTECYFKILPRDISTLNMKVAFASEIQAKYGVYVAQDQAVLGKGLSYNGYQHRPDVVYIELYDDKGVTYSLYRTGVGNDYVKLYDENYVTVGTDATYAPLFRILNVDIDEYGITGNNADVDATKAYYNNVNAFTYNGSNSANAPRFTIVMDPDGSGDLVGQRDIYFNIAKMDLSEHEYTVDNQADDEKRIYMGEPWHHGGDANWKMATELVFVNVKVDAVWKYNDGTYVAQKNPVITHVFANENYSKLDLSVETNKKAFDEIVRIKLGADLGDGKQLVDKKASNGTITGQEYFTTWSGTFSITGYENNVNVTRDDDGNVIAGAKVNVKFVGNSESTATTAFKINPVDLSKPYKDGAKNAGFFDDGQGGHLDILANESYDGTIFMPKPTIAAHLKGVSSGTALNENVDFFYTYGDSNYDNVNVASGGIVYVEGVGNYTGTISITFNIIPMRITSVIAKSSLAPKEYVGEVPNYQLEAGTTLTFEITYQKGATAPTKTYTLTYGVDFENLGTKSTNFAVSTLESKSNFIHLQFTGLNPDSGYVYGTGGNFYYDGVVKVYFAITERQLSSIENSLGNNVYTQWSTTGYTQIVYDGTVKQNLSVRCYGQGIASELEATMGDIVVKDGAKYLEYGVDYVVSGWGDQTTNLNAGNGAIVILEGRGNYAGTLEVPFTILQRDISNMNTDGIVLEGYSFAYAGVTITPNVNSVSYDDGSLALTLSTNDYEVSYTNGSRDNLNVKNGGAVVITGVGNYKGSRVRTFDITPIDQTLTFDSNVYDYNDIAHLKVEENEVAKPYADYFVNADGEYVVTLKATTTAVSSGKASDVVFMQTNANGFESNKANVTIVSTVVENGIATTTATFKFGNTSYGIVHVYATHVDEYGNYNSYARSEYTFKIYGKRQNSAPGIESLYQITYGDTAFTVFTDLKSEALIGVNDYKLVYDEDVLTISKVTSSNKPAFTIDERAVSSEEGTAVKFAHDDYVGLTVTNGVVSNDERAFIAFEKTFTVKVLKRELHISVVRKEVEFGTKPADITFEYSYKTPVREGGVVTGWVNGNVNGDTFNDIVVGLKTDYSPTLHSDVGVHTLNVLTTDQNFMVVSQNYEISYGTGEFEITKKKLTLSLNGIAAGNLDMIAFSKLYGASNPTGLRLGFVGLINETDSSAESFVAPTIAFVDENGNAIDEFTTAGTYTVRTIGGSAPNYEFVQGEFRMEIKPTSVRIALDSKTEDYTGLSVEPNAPIISGILGGVEPIEGYTITFNLLDSAGAVVPGGAMATSAGGYKIRVIFTPATEEKNYVRTEVDFANAIVINKVAPIITFQNYAVEYSGDEIDARLIRPSVSGIGEEPKVTTVARKLFASSDQAGDIAFDNCHIAGNYELFFTETPPTNKGNYDVIFVYQANPQDNYTDLVVRFNSAITITTGIATVTQRVEKVNVTFNAKGHSLSLEEHFFPITYKPSDGASMNIDGSNTQILYKVDGVYTTELPVNAGSYDVLVRFVPVASDADVVTEWDYEFAGMLVIDYVDIFDPSRNYVSLSRSQTTYVYNGYGHPLDPLTDVQLNGVPGDTSKPKGTISIAYYKGGNMYLEPKDAGTYDVQVTYTAVLGDNYRPISSQTKVFSQAVVINKAKVTINSITPVSYVYNGAGKNADGASCYGVQLKDGTYEIPEGTLSYKYRKSGTANEFTATLPKDVGDYDVRITYTAVLGGNYLDGTEITETRRITITKATPTIIINDMVFNYGEEIVVNYTVRGAQFDLEGPMNEIKANPSAVVIKYGTRFTAVGGGTSYEWSLTPPTKSGKYAIRIEFSPASNSNYNAAIQPQYDVLTIKNIVPSFEFEPKTVAYDGGRHVANEVKVYYGEGSSKVYYTKWDGIQEGGNFYRGTLGYEYRKSGSSVWTTVAPSAVGVYDVRVRYYENGMSDVFTSATSEYLSALTIEQLIINVMPIYGQGHLYDGVSIDGGAIAYVYSYEKDGYKYNVYTRAGDLDRKEVIDFSEAEYVQENGYVYTILTDASLLNEAWLTYYEKALRLVSGSFIDGETLVSFEFSALGVSEGKGEFTAENGKRYVVDLDLNLVYLSDETNYTLSNQNGYYFSIVDGKGAVNVIEIIPQNVIYAEGSNVGLYTVTTAGKQTVYSVNLETLTASANGEVYTIYKNVGIISYNTGSSVAQIKVDFSSFYEVTEEGVAVYKSANGNAYLIDLNTSNVEKVAVLNVDTVEFEYASYYGAIETATVDVSALSAIYTANAYVGEYEVRADLKVIIDLERGVARIPTYYLLQEVSTGLYSFTNANGIPEAFSAALLSKTNKVNEYIYNSNMGATYIVDFNKMIVRDVSTKYLFDGKDARLYQEINGEEVGFDVDVRNLSYKVSRNGKLYDTTTLYGRYYEVEKATLIAGNEWSGNMSILAQGAGEYEILQGSLSASANYRLYFVGGVYYQIDKAKLTVTFEGEEGAIYDGTNKFISYEIHGVLAGDSVGVSQSYDGDNLNVTEKGYRTIISINTPNYYLEGGVSEWYYIAPASMQEIIVPESKPIIYDGAKHYLELKDVERGAKVSYAGSQTAPYFVEPGTYSVIATVSKPNYVSLEVELKLTIAKAKYVVYPLDVPGSLEYGDALPSLMCDSTLGYIALDPGQVLLPSVTTYTWTFTPYSQDFYKYYEGNSLDGSTITGTIELKVGKAKANIEVKGELLQTETNPSAIIGFVNGLSHNESELITIEYVAGDGTRYAKMPTAPGKYTVLITYAGDENYAETTYTTILTIEQESNFEWLIYVGGGIGVLMLLSTVFFLVRKQKKID